MIFTESTIKISNNVSKMDSTIVLYRGDKNVEIRFTILQSPFKYSNTVATNVIESTNASYGQLVIKTPNDKPPIFSEVSATKEGTVLFTITKEMIDEIEELGVYTFQIRLMDENKQSRVTIPPVENGIEIKEPIAIEDDNTTNVVGLAKANYAVATLSDVDTPAFDDNGQYIKTNWNDGDIITNASLNKIEDGIYTTNENVTVTKKYVDEAIDDKADVLELKNIETISEKLYSKNFLIVESKLSDIISFEQMKNSTANPNYKAPLFVCNINKSLDNLNDFDELFFSIKYKVGNKIKTGSLSVKIKYRTSVRIELADAIDYSGTKITYSSMSVILLPNKKYTDASTSTDDNSYCTLQVRFLMGYISEEDINSIKNSVISVYVRRRNYLTLDNSNEFIPTDAYQPATKRYVDNKFLIDELETVLTVPKSELDKSNDTGAGISPSQNLNVINPNDGKHIYYACYGDIINELTYVSDKTVGYTGTLCELEDGNAIELCMTFSNNNLVTCSTGVQSIKNYVFTNDLIIKSKKILEASEIATKKYVDDNILLEQLPILRIDETNKRIYVNCNNMGTYKKYFVPNKYANVYGFSFIYTNEDSSETEIALIGGAMTRDDFILCARNTDTLFILILGGTDKYKYTKSTKTLEKGLYGYLKIGNTQEYAPTNDYNPATKKYVDDKVASLPQLSFNEAGELVVTINGVSKTFVPKNV